MFLTRTFSDFFFFFYFGHKFHQIQYVGKSCFFFKGENGNFQRNKNLHSEIPIFLKVHFSPQKASTSAMENSQKIWDTNLVLK